MSDNKYTSEDLKIMQSWPLERKIQVTQTRIIEWYQKNDGKVYVSFSGGKDSTVLLDLVRRIYPDVPAVFYEFPVSDSQAYKMLGNGWTCEVIAHLIRSITGSTE